MDKNLLIILVAFAVVILIFMSGRKVIYYCNKCHNRWKGTKHHSSTAPTCPACGSSDISRK